jgi:hypothetical protein
MIPLPALEAVIDASGAAPAVEACCPPGSAGGSWASAPCCWA